MRPGPTKRPRSLRRRLYAAQLSDLHVAGPPKAPRAISDRRRAVRIGRLQVALIVVLVQFVIVASGMPGRRSPRAIATSQLSLTPRAAGSARLLQPTPEVTDRNVEDLARILMSEAAPGVANELERIAVGYTVLNRMERAGTRSVRDVWSAYARQASPNDQLRDLALKILRREVADVSGGATHFYSPRSMPRAGDRLAGFDVGGGLEQTAGLRSQNYRPGWSMSFEPVAIDGVRATHFKFFRAATDGPVR